MSASREEYKQELKRLQSRLKDLHNRIYRKKIPVIICYEGWDAAGKGGISGAWLIPWIPGALT